MSERVTKLANQFEQACTDFLAVVNGLPDAQWDKPLSEDDPRPAGVVAHHVASGYEATTGALQGLLAGADLGLTWDMIHGGNAAHAAANHGAGRKETVALLQSNSANALAVLRGLSDEQLDQLVPFSLFSADPIPAQAVIEGLVIGHVGMHIGDFQV